LEEKRGEKMLLPMRERVLERCSKIRPGKSGNMGSGQVTVHAGLMGTGVKLYW
jgi:hypothetical protein